MKHSQSKYDSLRWQDVIIAVGIFILLFLFTTWLVIQPAVFSSFNLSENTVSNIGATIGGIAAPLIGIGTIVMLYVTFKEQRVLFIEQKSKNETDELIHLFNELRQDINSFYYQYRETNIVNGTSELSRFENFEALWKFAARYNGWSTKDYTFANIPVIIRLAYVISTFEIARQRLQASRTSPIMRRILEKKLSSTFHAILFQPLAVILPKCENDNKQDERYYYLRDYFTESQLRYQVVPTQDPLKVILEEI